MLTPMDLDSALADAGARHVVPLSGGKDSTALAVHLSQNHPEVPFEYVFSDTGAELPETYAYFDRLEHVLDAPVKRVSALEMLDLPEKPGRSAFDVILFEHFAGFLPSPRSRWCTRMLKIHPFERHVGSDRAYSYIAIRSDEQRKGYTGSAGKPVVLSEKPTSRRSTPSRILGSVWPTSKGSSTRADSAFPGTTLGARARAATSAFTNRSRNGKASRTAIPTCLSGRRVTNSSRMVVVTRGSTVGHLTK